MKPCPSYITTSDGERRYCEQGEDGHEGTCHGDRSQMWYDFIVRAATNENEPQPHRATITVEWYPSASIGEAAAVHELLRGMCSGLMEILQSWGVLDPSLAMEFDTNEPDDGPRVTP